MIELEHDGILFSAVDTWMHQQIFPALASRLEVVTDPAI